MEPVKLWLQRNLKGDPILWGIVLLFSFISIAVVYSATGTLAYKKMGGNTEYFLFKHTGLIFVGLGFMWLAHRIDYRYYSRCRCTRCCFGAAAAVHLFHGLEHQRGLALAHHSGYQPNLPAFGLSQAGPDFSPGQHAQPAAAARAGFQDDAVARNAVGGY